MANFKGTKNWKIRYFNEEDLTEGFFVEADKLDVSHPHNIEVLQEDSGTEQYPNAIKHADAELMVQANRVAMIHGDVDELERKYEELKRNVEFLIREYPDTKPLLLNGGHRMNGAKGFMIVMDSLISIFK